MYLQPFLFFSPLLEPFSIFISHPPTHPQPAPHVWLVDMCRLLSYRLSISFAVFHFLARVTFCLSSQSVSLFARRLHPDHRVRAAIAQRLELEADWLASLNRLTGWNFLSSWRVIAFFLFFLLLLPVQCLWGVLLRGGTSACLCSCTQHSLILVCCSRHQSS